LLGIIVDFASYGNTAAAANHTEKIENYAILVFLSINPHFRFHVEVWQGNVAH
jgi:hypothetical protein